MTSLRHRAGRRLPTPYVLAALAVAMVCSPTTVSGAADPVSTFWAAYARNFDLAAVHSLQLTCAIERVAADSVPRWRVTRMALQETRAWYEVLLPQRSAAVPLEPKPPDRPERPTEANDPAMWAYWCNGEAEYKVNLLPASAWEIRAVGQQPQNSEAFRLGQNLLQEFGFRPGGAPYQSDGTSYEWRADERVIVVRFAHGAHYFEYYVSDDPKLNGLPAKIRMFNRGDKLVAAWAYEEWTDAGGIRLPTTVEQVNYLPAGAHSFDEARESSCRTERWHILHARVNGAIAPESFTPWIPDGHDVLDFRFDSLPLHYVQNNRRTQEQLLEMAAQEKVRRDRR